MPRQILRLTKLWLLASFTLAAALALAPGRPWTNDHPEIRGGGDWGFGGADA